MKRHLLLAFFISSFFTNIHPKYECLKLCSPISIFLGVVSVLAIRAGNQDIKTADKIINCDPIEKYEELKEVCSTFKDEVIVGNKVISCNDKSLYFRWLENKENKEKLKEITYYIGKNVKNNGNNSIEFGYFLISLNLLVNSILGYVDYTT